LDQEDVEEAVVCDEEISGWAQHLQDYGVSIEDIARENALVSKNLVVESCSFEEKDLIDEDLTGWQLTSKESRGVQFVQEEDEVEIEQFEDVEIEEFQDVEIEQFGDVERKTFEENEVEQIEGVSSEDFELNECNYVEEVNMGGNSAETFTNMVSFKSLKAKLEECSFENEGLNRVSEWNQISCESQEEILPGCNKKPVNKSISNESLNGKKILRCPIANFGKRDPCEDLSDAEESSVKYKPTTESDDDVYVLHDVDPIQPFFGDKHLVEIQSDDTRDFENEDEYYDLNDKHRRKYPFPSNKNFKKGECNIIKMTKECSFDLARISQTAHEEFEAAAKRVDKKFRPSGFESVCRPAQNSLVDCYNDNPGKPLACYKQLNQFKQCVADTKMKLFEKEKAATTEEL